MKQPLGCIVLAVLSLLLPVMAQTTGNNSAQAAAAQTGPGTTTVQVPRLVKFSGVVQNFNADAAGGGGVTRDSASTPARIVGMTFSFYAEQTGGVPLWSEVQNVRVDNTGHYTVQLGFTKPEGLPVELFSSAQAQWLGVRQEGGAEQPRIMLLSVPYALKAADAETFGGKPPSAYLTASSASVPGRTSTGLGNGASENQNPTPHPLSLTGNGTTNYVPVWTSASNLASSVIYQASNHYLGIGTTSPNSVLSVQGGASDTTAIYGVVSGTSGTANGVYGSSASTNGFGVYGKATATTGPAYGVDGQSSSTSGIGVAAYATSATGANFGVVGQSDSPGGTAVYGNATSTTGSTTGVWGQDASSAGMGVYGNALSTTGTTYGVLGQATSPDGDGVGGLNQSTTGNAIGVNGQSNSMSGMGVLGNATATTGTTFGVKGLTASPSGTGVYGKATSATGSTNGVQGKVASPDGFGVYSLNTSTTGNGVAVFGSTASPAGSALFGEGISGSATNVNPRPIGVWGSTNQTGGAAVVGTADNAIAMLAVNNSTSDPAAEFENAENTDSGSLVFVAQGNGFSGYCYTDASGDLSCTGSKSAVVPVDSGTRKVALYAVEAPDNWFEDAGSARLSHGSAVVSLEPTFAQTVNGGIEYHVFLTPNGDCKGLYVTNKTADSFEVRELGGGTASIAFDYRIMARRKGYESIRLADKTEIADLLAKRRQAQRKSATQPARPSTDEDTVPAKLPPHARNTGPKMR